MLLEENKINLLNYLKDKLKKISLSSYKSYLNY